VETLSDVMVEFHGGNRSRKFNFFWRTRDMMKPQLLYAKSPTSGEVACIASLVPTFEPPAPQEDIEILRDEEPEMTEISHGKDFHFIFVVDRSGSMRGPRMTAANDALKIFMRSLPTGCRFSILGFGSSSVWHSDPHSASFVIPYNEESMNFALQKI